MVKAPFVVLLAEDNQHDILATRRAWERHKIHNPLYIVRDGEECLDYLYQRGKYSDPADAPKPGILLLDIKMPKMDGHAVLAHIREDPHLRHLPVIVLTTSKAEEDLFRSYELGANAYVTKPIGFDNFSKAVAAINLFWELVELPRQI